MVRSTRRRPEPSVENDWLEELRSTPVIRPGRFAEISHMPRSSVYDAIANGSLPSLRVGRSIMMPTLPLLEKFGAGEQVPGG